MSKPSRPGRPTRGSNEDKRSGSRNRNTRRKGSGIGRSSFDGDAPKQRVYRSSRPRRRAMSDPDRPLVDEAKEGVRINKFLASLDIASRRTVDQWIEEGRIKVNNAKAVPGIRIKDNDEVKVDGRVISRKKPKRQYLLLNKPQGIVCTMDENVPGNLTDYLQLDFRVFPVGRLDKASTGLLLLTNDGSIVNPILRGQYAHKKVYEVEVDRPITDEFCRRMAEGVNILRTRTLPAEVVPTGRRSFNITLTQGLNRQIRRMTEAMGYNVTKLRRIQIMHLGIKGLPEGTWRPLTHGELVQLDDILEQGERQLQDSLAAAENDYTGEE